MPVESYEERHAREARTIADLRQRVGEIVKLLGPEWALTPSNDRNDRHCYVTDKSGRELSLSVDTWRRTEPRIEIRGVVDTGDRSLGVSIPPSLKQDAITVTLARPAEAIVKSIRSRFLPGYDAERKYVAEEILRATECRNKRLSTARRLGELAGEDPKLVTAGGFSSYRSKGVYAEAKVYLSGVDLKITNCSEELAAEILTLMKQHRDAKGG